MAHTATIYRKDSARFELEWHHNMPGYEADFSQTAVDDIVKSLAAVDVLNFWNSRHTHFALENELTAISAMPEPTRQLLIALGVRDGRGYQYMLELYVHIWDIIEADFVDNDTEAEL